MSGTAGYRAAASGAMIMQKRAALPNSMPPHDMRLGDAYGTRGRWTVVDAPGNP